MNFLEHNLTNQEINLFCKYLALPLINPRIAQKLLEITFFIGENENWMRIARYILPKMVLGDFSINSSKMVLSPLFSDKICDSIANAFSLLRSFHEVRSFYLQSNSAKAALHSLQAETNALYNDMITLVRSFDFTAEEMKNIRIISSSIDECNMCELNDVTERAIKLARSELNYQLFPIT